MGDMAACTHLDGYQAKGDRNMTRYNAEEVDLNRDNVGKIQPETQAGHPQRA
jgi:hypothetical protein